MASKRGQNPVKAAANLRREAAKEQKLQHNDDMLGPEPLIKGMKTYAKYLQLASWQGLVQEDPSTLYQLLACLGQGGEGTVHSAVRLDTGEAVAFKSSAIEGEAYLRMHCDSLRACRSSAASSAMLVMPVRIGVWHDGAAGRYNKKVFVWEEQPLLTGSPLDKAVAQQQAQATRPPSQGPLGGVLVQLAAALLQAELCGLVHLDLKQDNVWLGEDGVLRLLDWGMCSRTGVPLRLMNGTLLMMPPEMLDEDAAAKCKTFSAKQDWYMVGMLLFQLLATNLQDHPFLEPWYANGSVISGSSIGRELDKSRGQIRPSKGFQSAPAAWRQLVQGLLCFDVSARWGLDEVLRSQAFAESASVHLAGLSSHPRLHGEMQALNTRMEQLGVQLALQPVMPLTQQTSEAQASVLTATAAASFPPPGRAPQVHASAIQETSLQHSLSMTATADSCRSSIDCDCSSSANELVDSHGLLDPAQSARSCVPAATACKPAGCSTAATCATAKHRQHCVGSVQALTHTASGAIHSWPGAWPHCNMPPRQPGSSACRALSFPCTHAFQSSTTLALPPHDVHTRPHAASSASRACVSGQQPPVPYEGGSGCVCRSIHSLVTGWRWLACSAWTGAAAGRLGMLLAHI